MELYEVIIRQGEDVRQVLSDYVLEKKWDEAIIIGAVGSIIDSAYNAPKDNSIPMNLVTNECPNAAEIVGFNGEIMKREKMDPNLAKVYKDKSSPLFVHIHACCATGDGKIYGGGLVKGKAFRGIRIFLTPIEQKN